MSKQNLQPQPSPVGIQTLQAVKTSLKLTAFSMFGVVLVAAIVAGICLGATGLKSVGLCAIAALLMVLITTGSHLFTLKNQDLMMAGIGADFMLKVIALLGLVLVARRLPGLNPLTLFLTMLALILAQALVFSFAVTRLRVPLLNQQDKDSTES